MSCPHNPSMAEPHAFVSGSDALLCEVCDGTESISVHALNEQEKRRRALPAGGGSERPSVPPARSLPGEWCPWQHATVHVWKWVGRERIGTLLWDLFRCRQCGVRDEVLRS